MKKFILLFTFSICLMPYAFPQQYGWQDINDNIPDTYDLSDVYFVSENEGWITVSNEAIILHTTNGGATFEIQTTQFPTEALYMIDENEGYAGGTSGFVYRTNNGGETWTHHGSISATLTNISFPPSGIIGYCCGFSGKIYSIDSIGVTPMIDNAGTVNLKSICFPNSADGWVCGESLILHFNNDMWNADQLYPSGGYNSVYFTNSTLGWAVGDNGLIIHTINGGANWSTQANSDTRSLFEVFFINANKGWAVGIDGALLHTNNGGTTWIVEEVQTNAFLRGIHFSSPINGFAVGNNNTLLKYTDISGIGEETQAVAFELFPNPVSDKFEVRSSEFEEAAGKVELYELNGKKVLEDNIEKGKERIEIDVGQLDSGMYLCKITIGKRSSSKKIIKE